MFILEKNETKSQNKKIIIMLCQVLKNLKDGHNV